MLGFSPLRYKATNTSRESSDQNLPGSVIDLITSRFISLTARQRVQLMVHLFQLWLQNDVDSSVNQIIVPNDFLQLTAQAMKNLQDKN